VGFIGATDRKFGLGVLTRQAPREIFVRHGLPAAQLVADRQQQEGRTLTDVAPIDVNARTASWMAS
jgi:hypothetical protein